MVVPAWHAEFLKQPLSFWIATTNLENIPEPAKCTGILFEPESDTFTCFVPSKFTEKILQDLKENPIMSLVGVELHTYEGYQYKGHYIAKRDCTQDEVDYQYRYMKEFTDILESFGYSGAGYLKAYIHPPFVALIFRVTQVFDQSPKVGTGGEIKTEQS
jgi:hypothetical protein